jgi:fructoselysine-6-P-deglycase FrlB-like protein
MFHVDDEIRFQPEAWSRAASLAERVAVRLPQKGERVAVIGCGTSLFMAEAYAMLREESEHGETDFFTATHFPVHRRYDRLLAITRSGTTTEVLDVAEQATCPVVAITADPATPVTEIADDTVVLDFADEKSVVQTVFATTVLMLLRAGLGHSIDTVIGQAEQILATPSPGPAADLDHAQQFSFLGQGWVHGIAREASLKMREAAQAWTESYPQMEYRHGPIAIAEPGRVVWIFGEPVPGLLDDVKATGAIVRNEPIDPVADLVAAQLLAVRLATAKGLDPDRPRHLSRSVILPK